MLGPDPQATFHGPHAAPVRHRDRLTGAIVDEPIFAESTLRFLYENPLGRWIFRLFLNNKSFCDYYGRRVDSPRSRSRIAPFVSQFNIDINEAEKPMDAYACFNDFFFRKLKPGVRPFPSEPGRLASPGDGKLLVYPQLAPDTNLPIKGLNVSPAGLLASVNDAAAFAGGAALVLRLAPPDYHRFHFSDGGVASAPREIPGAYHSVNPIALAQVPDLFCRNKRTVTVLEADQFGRVAIIEVGAITIGTIVQTHAPGRVEAGQEKGYFRYGGSTIVMLFEADRVAFDADLVCDSAAGLEVRVRAGEAIGRRVGVSSG